MNQTKTERVVSWLNFSVYVSVVAVVAAAIAFQVGLRSLGNILVFTAISAVVGMFAVLAIASFDSLDFAFRHL